MPKVHDVVAAILASHGVDTVFGVIGDGNFLFLSSMVNEHNTRYVPTAMEAGSIAMADGYARASGALSVATTTHGPGLTNTITALIEASRNRTPMVVVTGQVPGSEPPYRRSPYKLQGVDQRALIAPTGAGYEIVRSAESAGADTIRAVQRCLSESRPIVLAIPVDVAEMNAASPPRTARAAVARTEPIEADDLDRALGVVASARRPLVLAGRGALAPAARDAVRALAERIDAPIVTTLLAKDAFHDTGRAVGVLGTFSDEATSDWAVKADCVIAMGAGLNPWTTLDGSLFNGKSVVHIDQDRLAIGKWCDPTASVCGDLVDIARSMVRALDDAGLPGSGFVTSELGGGVVGAPAVDRSSERGADIEAVIPALDAALPSTRNLVFDIGRFWLASTKGLRVSAPGRAYHTFNYASIGLGTSLGLGVAVADPQRTTVVVTGDGGFMLGGLSEVPTAVRNRLNVVVVVMNDGCYGAEHHVLKARQLPVDLSMMNWPDLAGVARAMGAESALVRSPADLAGLRDALTRRSGPLLVDLRLDPDLITTER